MRKGAYFAKNDGVINNSLIHSQEYTIFTCRNDTPESE